MQKGLATAPAGAYLPPREAVVLGTLHESEQRVKRLRAMQKDGISPYSIAMRADVTNDRNKIWEQMIKNGFGATIAATIVIEHLDLESDESGSMAFGRETLRSLGFLEPPTWVELWAWSKEHCPACPLSAAPALLISYKSVEDGKDGEDVEVGEVGDGCRLLTKPVFLDGNWHYLYVSGNGPTLYAFPFIPGTKFSLDMEIMFRIKL